HKHMNGNFSLGLGVKLPTGDYGAESVFYNQGPERNLTQRLTVDQSIQPGDGGLGITFDFQAYRMLSHNFMLNAAFYYLANPRETNEKLASSSGNVFSVHDQYAARLVATYITGIKRLSVYLGARQECVPVYDLIGGSDGFRSPGHIISAEPGINYSWSSFA